jgi:hypothetical protein
VKGQLPTQEEFIKVCATVGVPEEAGLRHYKAHTENCTYPELTDWCLILSRLRANVELPRPFHSNN